MAEAAQLAPQLDIVVDLAVLHRPEASPLVRKRLVASFKVDDREPRSCDADPPVQQEPGAVGASMSQLAGHRQQERLRRSRIGASVDSCQAAHVFHAIAGFCLLQIRT